MNRENFWFCIRSLDVLTYAIKVSLRASTKFLNPDRAPLKEVLGGQYTITEKGEDKCCGKALKAAGGVEVVNVVRIRAPKK